jgi:dsDNA-binding SOS-regulon protein
VKGKKKFVLEKNVDMKTTTYAEREKYHQVVYLKDTVNTAVELPTLWRDDRKRAVLSTWMGESEATDIAGLPQQ